MARRDTAQGLDLVVGCLTVGGDTTRAARRTGLRVRRPPPGGRGRRPRPPPCCRDGSAGRRTRGSARPSWRPPSRGCPAPPGPGGGRGRAAAELCSAASSEGSSACIRISSRMTCRSASRSAGRRAGRHMMSERMSRPKREVLGQQPDVEGGVLLGGEGVEVAADLVDRLGDGRGRSVGGALEQQVLEEVRRAGSPAAPRRGTRSRPRSRCTPSGRPPSAR